MGTAIAELLSGLFNVWKEMLSVIFAFIPKAISFVLWIIVGIIVLPCVFIAGNIFPLWSDWGEGF
jgi:hypothetical protein